MPRKRGKRYSAETYDRATKRKRYIGMFDTKKEARDAEAAFRLRSRTAGTSRETCNEFADRWADDYPRPRESTNLQNAERVQAFSRDFKGVRLSEVDRPAARRWALEHPQHARYVRTMFEDAVRDGIVESNPFANLRLPGSKGRKHMVALTEPELVELADLCLDGRMELGPEFGPEYRAMILFAGYVGLRPGELYALRREDWRGDTAEILRAYDSKTRRIGPTKTEGGVRTVIVPPPARAALSQVPVHGSGLLFESPMLRPWTQVTNHRYWTRLRLLADRPGLAFYALRHVAATFLLERGNTPWDVSIQLGHVDGGRLVQSLYGHPAHDGARARMLASYGVSGGLVEAPASLEQRRRGVG